MTDQPYSVLLHLDVCDAVSALYGLDRCALTFEKATLLLSRFFLCMA